MGNKVMMREWILERSIRKNILTGSRTYVKTQFPIGFSRLGADRPDWKKRIQMGLPCTNALNVSKVNISYIHGSAMSSRPSALGPTQPPTIIKSERVGLPIEKPILSVSTALRNKVEQAAAIGLLKKIRSTRAQFSGPQFLGELGDAIHQLRNPAEALRDLANDLVKNASPHRQTGNARSARERRQQRNAAKKRRTVGDTDFAKPLADSWLEFAFGAAPLFADLAAIAESAITLTEPRSTTVKFSIDDAEATERVLNFLADIDGFNAYYNETLRNEVLVKYRCSITRVGNIDSGSLGKVVQAGGFDFDNIIPTAWELLPWSFLADYFSNIGDILSASCVSLAGVSNFSHTVVQKTTVDRHGGKLVNTNPAVSLVSFSPPSYKASAVQVTRDALAPAVDLTVRFSLPGRPYQLLNMAALLGSRL